MVQLTPSPESAGTAPPTPLGDLPLPDESGGRHRARVHEAKHLAPPQNGTKPAHPGSMLGRFLKDVAFVVVAALILSFLLRTFLIQSFYIPSESMEPTLRAWERVVVTKLAPGVLDVHRGDIVVFRDPDNWLSDRPAQAETSAITGFFREVAQGLGLAPADAQEYVIKRVIGLGGDRVACRGGDAPVTVNGIPIDETYIAPGAHPSALAFDVLVPEDALWVMGDNRDHSGDSRVHMDSGLGGAVPMDLVVGVAQVRTWPLGRVGLLRNPGSVFARVPSVVGGDR